MARRSWASCVTPSSTNYSCMHLMHHRGLPIEPTNPATHHPQANLKEIVLRSQKMKNGSAECGALVPSNRPAWCQPK